MATSTGAEPHEGCRLPLNIGFLPLPVDPISKAMTHPLRSTGITPLQHYYEAVPPLRRISTFGLAVGAACAFSFSIAGQVLTFRTRARLSFAPPPCRMPLGQSQSIPQADPGGVATPRFWHRLIRFRHVISGSLALASLNHTCRNLVPTFPQRSPPSLLTTAACGGLRSIPDCRPRRAFLHLSYSYAAPCGPALLVTKCHKQTHALQQTTCALQCLSRSPDRRWRGASSE